MDAPVTHHEEDHKAEDQFKRTWKKQAIVACCLAGLFAVYVLGTNHIVQSEKGTALVRKVHFTFSETFVSLDAIIGQPLIVVKAAHPLAVKALQRDGYIETDEAFQKRIESEAQEQFEKNQRDFRVQQQLKENERRAALYQDFKLSKVGSNELGVTGVLANNGSRTWRNVSIELKVLATDGKTVIGTAMDYFSGDIGPGQAWRFNAIVAHQGRYRVELNKLEGTLVE